MANPVLTDTAAAGGKGAMMFAFDQWLLLWINAGPSTPNWCIVAARLICNAIPALAVTVVVAVAAGRPAWRQPVWRALLAMALAWLLVSLFRASFAMPRPGQLGLGIQWAPQGDRAGFPSMHTTVMFAFATALVAGGRSSAAWPMVALAVAVGWCRIVLGLHFPSDVLAGVMLGTALGWGLGRPWRQHLRPELAHARNAARTPAPHAAGFFSRGTRPIR